MCKEAVVGHANTETSRNPPEKSCQEERLPGKEEERGNGADVEGRHEGGGDPIDFVVSSGFAFKSLNIHGGFHSKGLDVTVLGKVSADERELCNSCVIGEVTEVISGYGR
jgi:hypothetical protein